MSELDAPADNPCFDPQTSIVGYLDLPLAESLLTGAVTVAGWAYSTDARIVRVDTFIDGVPLGPLEYGIVRPEVPQAFPGAPLANGFAGDISPPEGSKGRAQLVVRVAAANGECREFQQTVYIERPVIRVVVDEPAPEYVSGGGLLISGWALGLRSPIRHIDVLLDGRPVGTIPYGYHRADVYAWYRDRRVARNGFRGLISVPDAPPGRASLTIRASDLMGNHADAVVPIHFESQRPIAEIERAVWRGDMLELTGWGLIPQGTARRTARIFLNDSFIGETDAIRSRPDIRHRYAHLPDADRSGFHARLPVFDPRAPSAAGVLVVEVMDRDGRRAHCTAHIKHEPADGAHALGMVEEIRSLVTVAAEALGRPASLLDWATGLDLATALPDTPVAVPPLAAHEPILPYIDASIDLVITAATDQATLREACRVAARAVGVVQGSDAPGNGNGPQARRLDVTWLGSRPMHPPIARATIIIPVHDQVRFTRMCLAQLEVTLPRSFDGEIVVIDDASTDETPAVLADSATHDPRLTIIRNETNLGFIASCNRAAAEASGETLIFLNNDTLPAHGWLPPLLRTLASYPEAGAVGGKLIFPNGRLQEAGAVVFSDGRAWNFGRNDEAVDHPLYSYVREVDYCSGALLATPRALFLDSGGFDARYAPAYYEDVDYCFRLRSLGYRVYYQPESRVVHFEGASSGTDVNTGVKRYMVVNRVTFTERWRDALEQQPAAPDHYDARLLYALASRGA
jgi:GT2 family glycosyltransferase